MWIWLTYLFALCIGLMRFFIPVHQPTLPLTFEAVAHLFLGFLIGVVVASKRGPQWTAAMVSIVSLCVIELVCFFLKL